MSKKLPQKLLDEIKLLGKELSESKLKKVQELVEQEYEEVLIAPGEAVGVIAAQSIGEPGTQMTLDTKLLAGVAEMNVTTGLPRIIEILDGRKTLKTPLMEVYLNKPFSTGKGIKELALRIKTTQFDELVKEFNIDISDFTIEAVLNKEKIKILGLTEEKVQKIISKSTKGCTAKSKDGIILFKVKSKDEDLNDVYKLKEKLKSTFVCGIKGVNQVLPVKRGEEYLIITGGTNLKEVLLMDEVDKNRTYSNDLYEVESVLGIEAARQIIMNEVHKVFDNQGLTVDVRHIMIVADTMCINGAVKGITRYGVISEKASVLARASFETPIKHLINACVTGEVDQLNSVIENIMINQIIPMGTGLPKLTTRIIKK